MFPSRFTKDGDRVEGTADGFEGVGTRQRSTVQTVLGKGLKLIECLWAECSSS